MALMALGELQSLQANDSSIDRLSTMHEGLKKALWQTGNSAQCTDLCKKWQSTFWWSGHPTDGKRVNEEMLLT